MSNWLREATYELEEIGPQDDSSKLSAAKAAAGLAAKSPLTSCKPPLPPPLGKPPPSALEIWLTPNSSPRHEGGRSTDDSGCVADEAVAEPAERPLEPGDLESRVQPAGRKEDEEEEAEEEDAGETNFALEEHVCEDFPDGARLRPWDPAVHVPCVGLVNPKSGGQKGASILKVCGRTEYFRDNIFSSWDVLGMPSARLAFQRRLDEAKQMAKESSDPSCRPRLICGGGDGTASLGLLVVFQALTADPERDGVTTNGFRWSDEELERYFPALVQMPLGTGNDLAGVLGWGRRFPGFLKRCWRNKETSIQRLQSWFDDALSLTTPVTRFDVWAFMPPPGLDSMDVKVCEVDEMKKTNESFNYVMRPAGRAVPFLVLLYASFGFSAHVVTRFERMRSNSRLKNFATYVRISLSLLCGVSRRPSQLKPYLQGMSVDVLDEQEGGACISSSAPRKYFPPDDRKGDRYSEVGFLNLGSYRGGSFFGASRASWRERACPCCHRRKRQPIDFGDGKADFFREKGIRTWVKSGAVLQTDKARAGTFSFEASHGKGIFVQFDGEGRFVFHPEGKAWRMDMQQVMRVPVAIQRDAWKQMQLSMNDCSDRPAGFGFVGPPAEVERIKARVHRWVHGELVNECNATPKEIVSAQLPCRADLIPNETVAPTSSATPSNTSVLKRGNASLSTVVLHVYDVSTSPVVKCVNAVLYIAGTGAYHVGVEVYGVEWSYGYVKDEEHPDVTGVFETDSPGGCTEHNYREAITLSTCNLTRGQVEDIISDMKVEWKGKDYDLLRHNCVDFSADLCSRLGVGPFPDWMHNLSGAAGQIQTFLEDPGGIRRLGASW